jgi:hypothetical protein
MMTKRDAALCLCMIFLDPVNELPPPSHRPEFDPASFRKGANGKDIKSERWVKASQKSKMPPLSEKLKVGKGISRKKNAAAIRKTEK